MEATLDKIQVEKYPAYKDSGVEWLGEIPAHWDLLANKYIFKLKKNQVGKKSGDFVLLSLTLNGVIKRDMENPQGKFPAEFDTYQEVKKGDFIFCLFDVEETPRAVGLSHFDGMITGAYTVVEASEDFDKRFLYYFYLNIDSDKRMRSLYKGLRNIIPKESFFSFKTFAPPKEEQTAIAEFLDRKTTLIDKAIDIKEKQIALLKERRQILIHKVVTGGLNPNVNMKDSGVKWIGNIPAHWNIKELRYLKKIGTEITYGIVQAGPDIPNGIPYIRTGDMYGDSFPISGYLKTSERIASSFHRSKVSKGDLVVAIRATLGKALLVPEFLEGANLTQGTAKICVGPELNNEYLFWAFNSYYVQTEIDLNAKGTTFREITLNKLRRISIALPNTKEQVDIVRYIENVNELISNAISLKEKEIKKLQEYKPSLINSAVTGKIKV